MTDRSVTAAQWGAFLTTIFDEWVRADVGRVFVTQFDAALAKWLDLPGGMCIFAETCGDAVALEHNGDVYSCDHFVEPKYLLGNIASTTLVELIAKPEQRAFGNAERDSLPRECRKCPVVFACHGECPRPDSSPPRRESPGSTTSATATRPSSPTSITRCGSWPTCCGRIVTPTR